MVSRAKPWSFSLTYLVSLAIAAASMLSGLYYLVDRGTTYCGMGTLFFPASRFSDLFLPIEELKNGRFAEFSEYPSGAALAFQLLEPLQSRTLNNEFSQMFNGLCPAPNISAAQLVTLILTSATIGYATQNWLARSSSEKRSIWVSVSLTFLTGAILASWYHLFLAVAGALVLSLMCVCWVRGLAPWPWLLFLPLGIAYPFMFSWDRGNLDGIVVLIILWAILFFRSQAVGSMWIAGMLIGVAIALKLWPLFLLGIFLRPMKLKALAAAMVSFIIVMMVGSIVAGDLSFTLRSIFGTAGRSNDLSSPWLFYFNRTLSSGINSISLIIEPYAVPPINSSVIPSVIFGALSLASIIFATWVMSIKSELWLRLSLASIIIILCAPTSGVYRSSILVIGLLLFLADKGSVPIEAANKPQVFVAALLALAVSPIYFGSLQQPGYETSPWQGPPSDTLIGTFGLVALAITLVWLQKRQTPHVN